MPILAILLFILVAAAIWAVMIYNNLISLRNQVDESWANIDVQLKRRYDLIPNMVETVKGYASHEKGVFEAVTQARANAIGAQTVEAQAKAEEGLSKALKSLFAVAENYPQLRAADNFASLQSQLTETENKIEESRTIYNNVVRTYNIQIQVFPNVIIADQFKFTRRDLFEVKEEIVREAPKVKF
ncbi:MAG: LemA family protein [bacterium]